MNSIGPSFYFKDDTHKEVPAPQACLGFPRTAYRPRSPADSSIGLQDVVTIAENLTATAGISAEHIDGIRAVDSGNKATLLSRPSAPATPSNRRNDFTACTPHQWPTIPRFRLPTLSRIQAGCLSDSREKPLPGPEGAVLLQDGQWHSQPQSPDRALWNWEIGYSRKFAANTVGNWSYSAATDQRHRIDSRSFRRAGFYPGACRVQR